MDTILCLPILLPKPALAPRGLGETADDSVKPISCCGVGGGIDTNIFKTRKSCPTSHGPEVGSVGSDSPHLSHFHLLSQEYRLHCRLLMFPIKVKKYQPIGERTAEAGLQPSNQNPRALVDLVLFYPFQRVPPSVPGDSPATEDPSGHFAEMPFWVCFSRFGHCPWVTICDSTSTASCFRPTLTPSPSEHPR